MKNRELHELLGNTEHQYTLSKGEVLSECSCGLRGYPVREICAKSIPDYAADTRLVLREMKAKLDGHDFEDWLCIVNKDDVYRQVDVDIILDTTGRLRDMAIEYLRGK